MGLGSLVQAASGGTPSLKKLIKAGFKRREEVPPMTEDSWIRASGFALMCPREEVLCARARVTRVREIDTDLLLIFEHGHGLHDRLQSHILSHPDVGAIRGKWTCVGCGAMHGGPPPKDPSIDTSWATPRPSKCEHCGVSEFQFFEVEYHDHDIRLKGHTDGYLVLPGLPSMGVLEAKSIKAGWSIKNVPKLEHAIQLQEYLLLSGLEWGIILYWIKGENGMEALVEHFVERDEDTISRIKSAIRGLRAGLMGGPLPDRVCASAGCPRATGCVVSESCFTEQTEEVDDDGDEHPF